MKKIIIAIIVMAVVYAWISTSIVTVGTSVISERNATLDQLIP